MAQRATPPWLWPTAGMLLTQTVNVLVFLTVPVLATEIAVEMGVPASTVGVYTSVVFVVAMVVSAGSGGFIRRYGGIRANQLGMLFAAGALLLALSAWPPLVFLSAALVGIGYGPNTPTGSHVLARVTPPEARGFVYSLKQSGAPLGGLLAGILVPAMVGVASWRAAVLLSATLAVAAVFAVQPLRRRLDDDRDAAAAVSFAAPWYAIAGIARSPGLRRLTLVAFTLTAVQSCLMSVLMVFLVDEVGLGLTLAGFVYATCQGAAAVCRVLLGWASDRIFGARLLLIVIALATAASFAAIAAFDGSWPLWAMLVVAALAGATSAGWNGVFLAEVAHLAGPQGVGAATGGALFFLYGGLVFGPAVFTVLLTFGGGYTAAFLALAVLTATAGLNLLRTPGG